MRYDTRNLVMACIRVELEQGKNFKLTLLFGEAEEGFAA